MKRNLYLTGLPGAGKTTIGKAVAKRLGYSFVESAEDIIGWDAKSMTELWDKVGEAEFRFRERVALLRMAHEDGLVVALTDGALIWENNRVTMDKTGLIVTLDRDTDKITFENEDHPTLPNGREDLEILAEDRDELYETFSRRVDNNGDPEDTVNELCEIMKKENDRFEIDWSQYQ